MPSLLQTRLPGCLIPAYWAVDSTRWDTLINTKNAYPQVPIAVVLNIAGNPGGGGGAGNTTLSAWTTLIGRLTSSNIIVLGYVDTNSGNDTEATVQGRIDSWKTLYSTIDGIFFDNMGVQTTQQTYYTNLANYAKTKFVTVAGNCKVAATVVETAWSNQTVPIDTFIVFDGEGLDPVDSSYSKYNALNNNQLAVIAFGVPAQDTAWNSQMAQYIGWIYVTTGTGTTPYNSLPTYFANFISDLNTIAGGVGTGATPTAAATGGTAVDKWGIQKKYFTKNGGEEYFMNMDDFTSEFASGGRIQNFEGENVVKQSDGSYQSNGGSEGDLRLEIWSPKYSDINQRKAACWLNVEQTIYQKTTSVGTSADPHPKCAHQFYMKGGHHTSARHCEGCAYKFRWWNVEKESSGSNYNVHRGSVSFDKEICHSAYAGDFGKTINNFNGDFGNGDWHGSKAVQYDIVENGNTYVKLELYADISCSDGNGNLVIRNNWKLLSSYIDRGSNTDAASPFSDCSGCGRTDTQVLNEPFFVTDTGSINYGRNICAYRTDKVTTRFKYWSTREIDPTKPVTADTTGGGGGGTPLVNDQFGIAMIYPTITNGYTWFMNMAGTTPNTDTTKFTMGTSGLSKNADGSFKVINTSHNLFVYQRTGYNPTTTANAAPNHSIIANRGYMQDVNDWRNVECTIQVRLNNTPTAGSFQWLTRGGRHLEPVPNCEGSSIRAYLFDNGETICSKEQWHSSFASEVRGIGIGSLLGKWIGYKFVVITKNVSGTLVTNQQIWVDAFNNNQWTKIDERTDAGGWGDQGGTCQGAPDQLISWGGPIVAFTWNSFTDIDFKNMSVREIDPNAVPAGAPPGGNSSLCGS